MGLMVPHVELRSSAWLVWPRNPYTASESALFSEKQQRRDSGGGGVRTLLLSEILSAREDNRKVCLT